MKVTGPIRIVSDQPQDRNDLGGSSTGASTYIAQGTLSASFSTKPFRTLECDFLTLQCAVSGTNVSGSIMLWGTNAPDMGRDPYGNFDLTKVLDTWFPMLTQSLSFPPGGVAGANMQAKVDLSPPYMARYSRIAWTHTGGSGSIRCDYLGKQQL
jgi:hypothetical protein